MQANEFVENGRNVVYFLIGLLALIHLMTFLRPILEPIIWSMLLYIILSPIQKRVADGVAACLGVFAGPYYPRTGSGAPGSPGTSNSYNALTDSDEAGATREVTLAASAAAHAASRSPASGADAEEAINTPF